MDKEEFPVSTFFWKNESRWHTCKWCEERFPPKVQSNGLRNHIKCHHPSLVDYGSGLSSIERKLEGKWQSAPRRLSIYLDERTGKREITLKPQPKPPLSWTQTIPFGHACGRCGQWVDEPESDLHDVACFFNNQKWYCHCLDPLHKPLAWTWFTTVHQVFGEPAVEFGELFLKHLDKVHHCKSDPTPSKWFTTIMREDGKTREPLADKYVQHLRDLHPDRFLSSAPGQH